LFVATNANMAFIGFDWNASAASAGSFGLRVNGPMNTTPTHTVMVETLTRSILIPRTPATGTTAKTFRCIMAGGSATRKDVNIYLSNIDLDKLPLKLEGLGTAPLRDVDFQLLLDAIKSMGCSSTVRLIAMLNVTPDNGDCDGCPEPAGETLDWDLTLDMMLALNQAAGPVSLLETLPRPLPDNRGLCNIYHCLLSMGGSRGCESSLTPTVFCAMRTRVDDARSTTGPWSLSRSGNPRAEVDAAKHLLRDLPAMPGDLLRNLVWRLALASAVRVAGGRSQPEDIWRPPQDTEFAFAALLEPAPMPESWYGDFAELLPQSLSFGFNRFELRYAKIRPVDLDEAAANRDAAAGVVGRGLRAIIRCENVRRYNIANQLNRAMAKMEDSRAFSDGYHEFCEFEFSASDFRRHAMFCFPKPSRAKMYLKSVSRAEQSARRCASSRARFPARATLPIDFDADLSNADKLIEKWRITAHAANTSGAPFLRTLAQYLELQSIVNTDATRAVNALNRIIDTYGNSANNCKLCDRTMTMCFSPFTDPPSTRTFYRAMTRVRNECKRVFYVRVCPACKVNRH
jgi:hypothetical protein